MKPLACLFTAACLLSAANYDLIIRNASIVDGTGAPAFLGDVAVSSGRIAAVGDLRSSHAAREIDARRHVLAPGFIDIHTHLEMTLGVGAFGPIEKAPGAPNFVRDGVTTLVTGNCGHSETDIAAFLSRVEKLPPGPNVASLVGHNDIRRAAMGTANRRANATELDRMKQLVAKAMRDGAYGLSTGLIYVPGTYANTGEVLALAREAGRSGGIYTSHMRDEGEHVIDAIKEAIQIGREAGIPVELSHFKIDNKRLWGFSEKTIALVEQCRREGVDVTIDQYPYERSSTKLSQLVPTWALADGDNALRARLSDPAIRARIVAEMKSTNESLGQADYSYALIASCPSDPGLNGKTISMVNVARQGKPGMEGEVEVILGMMARDPTGTVMIYHKMGAADVERIMKYPFTSIASDGWVVENGIGAPHPRSYGTNARVLAEYVRRQKILTIEDAIRKMTSLPAHRFGFKNRGRIHAGYAADLVLFDPATIQDRSTWEKPHQYSTGFDFVMVNGTMEVENDRITGQRSGQVLRHASPASPR